MSNTTEEQAVEETEAPERKQSVRNMAADSELKVGPFFPSGMNSVEAAISGATADMRDEDVAALQGDGGSEQGQISTGSGSSYDPGTETIDGVLAYVDKNPDQRDSVLEAERAGKNRTTLINQLESR